MKSESTSPLSALTIESSPAVETCVTAPSIVEEVLARNLFLPVRDLCNRPSKNLRAKLVRAGFYLAGESRDLRLGKGSADACDKLAEALEAIHAGSLIIDDIQDNSRERRGLPALHVQYGVPIALNAGNWLYFQPFDWIRRLELDDAVELRLYRLCHEAMLHAHLGQAIDVGTSIDEVPRDKVHEICLSSMRLKTGALTGLALSVGAAIGHAEEQRMCAIADFGARFGVGLQMFDDIGNFALKLGDPKRLEDFRLRRPTWLWSIAAEISTDKDFAKLVAAARKLPDDSALVQWIAERDLISIARNEATRHLDDAFVTLARELDGLEGRSRALDILQEVSERIQNAYG